MVGEQLERREKLGSDRLVRVSAGVAVSWNGLTCRWKGCAFTSIKASSLTVPTANDERYELLPVKATRLILVSVRRSTVKVWATTGAAAPPLAPSST